MVSAPSRRSLQPDCCPREVPWISRGCPAGTWRSTVTRMRTGGTFAWGRGGRVGGRVLARNHELAPRPSGASGNAPERSVMSNVGRMAPSSRQDRRRASGNAASEVRLVEVSPHRGPGDHAHRAQPNAISPPAAPPAMLEVRPAGGRSSTQRCRVRAPSEPLELRPAGPPPPSPRRHPARPRRPRPAPGASRAMGTHRLLRPCQTAPANRPRAKRPTERSAG